MSLPSLLRCATVAVAIATGAAATARGDSWRLPTKEKYYSSNRTYRADVTPRKISSQLKYFESKVDAEGSTPPVTAAADRPRVSLRKRQWLWYRERATFPLVNDVAPVDVAVSDRGDYVVTLDDWHGVGHGESVVVIYRSDGTIVRRLRLDELMAGTDTYWHFLRSVSSINWRESFRIDSLAGQLVVVVSSRESALPAGIPRRREVKVDLATGEVLEPREPLWPTPGLVAVRPAADLKESKPGAIQCDPGVTFELPGITRPDPQAFLDSASQVMRPGYPEIAHRARLSGRVVVELLVDASGAVRCARSVLGPPFLDYASVMSVRQWTFRSRDGESGFIAGRVEFEFGLARR